MQVILHYRAISSFEDTPGELKHLSTQRKRKIIIDSVSSGERKRNSPNHLRVGFGPRCGIQRGQPRGLGRPAGEGDSPVGES